jgi:hypothetical protein
MTGTGVASRVGSGRSKYDLAGNVIFTTEGPGSLPVLRIRLPEASPVVYWAMG